MKKGTINSTRNSPRPTKKEIKAGCFGTAGNTTQHSVKQNNDNNETSPVPGMGSRKRREFPREGGRDSKPEKKLHHNQTCVIVCADLWGGVCIVLCWSLVSTKHGRIRHGVERHLLLLLLLL